MAMCLCTHYTQHTDTNSCWNDFTERTSHIGQCTFYWKYILFLKIVAGPGQHERKGIIFRSLNMMENSSIWLNTSGQYMLVMLLHFCLSKMDGQNFSLPHRNPIRTVNYCQCANSEHFQFNLFCLSFQFGQYTCASVVVIVIVVVVVVIVVVVVVFNNNNSFLFTFY